MNRRYGLFEPATFVCAAVLLWPFAYVGILLIAAAFTFLPPSPPFSSADIVLLMLASLGELVFEATLAFVAAFALCHWLHNTVLPLSIQRIHLRTAMLLMLLSAVGVGVFVTTEHNLIVRSDSFYYRHVLATAWAYVPPTLVMLLVACLLSEGHFRYTLPAGAAPNQSYGHPFIECWERQWSDPSAVTLREQVLYALPLLGVIVIVVFAPILVEQLHFKTMRYDFPWICKPMIFVAGSAHPRICATLVVVLGLYVAVIARSRKRMLIFALLLLLAFLVGLFLLLLTLLIPILQPLNSCVAEGEPIDTPDGPRPIETLQPGDALFCCDDAGQRVSGRVEAVLVNSATDFLELECGDGLLLRVTSAHPIATPSGYRPAGELKIGDAVRTRDGVKPLQAIRTVTARVRVFDLSVTPHPNFYASGVLVHNKLRKK